MFYQIIGYSNVVNYWIVCSAMVGWLETRKLLDFH